MQKHILKYYPIKRECRWLLYEPLPITSFFGAKPKWEEWDDHEYSNSDHCTIIGSCSEGMVCHLSKWIWTIVSTAQLEAEIDRRKKAHIAAVEKEQKTNLGRTIVKGAALLGIAVVKVAADSHTRGGNITKTVNETVDGMFGISSNDLSFDEGKYKEEYTQIAGKNLWAHCDVSFYPDLAQGKRESGKMLFRGVPANYTGNRKKEHCITFQERENDYKIIEYEDTYTANQVWSDLQRYGFV